MANPYFHIIRNPSGVPLAGACTYCGRRFEVPEGEVWGHAEDFLRRKFEEHKCSRGDLSNSAVRNVP
jgi:hypothetical protein